MNAKTWIATGLLVALATASGWIGREYLGTSRDGATSSTAGTGDGPCSGGGAPLYWKAPMDPTYIRQAPGKSPMGMDLVPECGSDAGGDTGGGVRIAPEIVQNMGVRTASVERRDLTRSVRAVGRVDYDERLVEHVHTKFHGWIEKLYIEYEGEMVESGQPLLEIYSPELVSTQEELLIAARYREEMSRSSFPDVSRSGLELFDAAKRRLELWDIPKRDIDRLLRQRTIRKTLTLYAPSSGVVTHMMARKGMEVGANDNLYTVADLSRVWVYADVYEYELPWIAVGQRATVELSYMPGTDFIGTVTYIYPFLDPKTRTARVRIELANPELTLKPDMFANVRIEAQTRPQTLAVPEEAVIRSGRRSIVMVATGQGHFKSREVDLGLETGQGWLEIREGLREGERVVTSGQFLIDSESKLQEAVQKLLARDEPVEAAGEPEMAGHEMPDGGHSMHQHEMPEGAHAMPGHDMSEAGHSMHEHTGAREE